MESLVQKYQHKEEEGQVQTYTIVGPVAPTHGRGLSGPGVQPTWRRVRQLSAPTAKTNKQWAPTREPSWDKSCKRWWAFAAGVIWCVVVLLLCCLSGASGVWLRVVGLSRVWSLLLCLICACFLGSFSGEAVVGAVPRTGKGFQVSPSMFLDFGSLHQKPRAGGPPGGVPRDGSDGWRSPVPRGDSTGGGETVYLLRQPSLAGPADWLGTS